jgi:hypothetical protein
MADIRIKDLATTATTTASDDFMAVDGTTNGTRKLSAATPAFLTSVTTPSLTSPAATNLTLGTTSYGTALTVASATGAVTAATTLADQGGTIAAQRNGLAPAQGLVFDGTTNCTTSVAANGTGDFTYAIRFSAPDFSAVRSLFGTTSQVFDVPSSTSVRFYDGTAGGFSVTVPTLAANVVHSLAYVRSSGVLSVYLNGISAGTVACTVSISSILQVGVGAGSTIMKGVLGPLCAYNRALSAAEVLALYQSGAPAGADYPLQVAGTALITGDSSTFTSGVGSWIPYNGGAIAASGGKGVITGMTASAGVRYAPSFFIKSKVKYRLSLTTSSYVGGTAVDVVGISGATYAAAVTVGTTTVDVTGHPTDDDYLIIYRGGNSGTTGVSIDNVTMTPLGLLLAPDSNNAGAGLEWLDVSGNRAHIVLPTSGVTWSLPSSQQIVIEASTSTNGNQQLGGASLIDANKQWRIQSWTVNCSTGTPTISLGDVSAGTQFVSGAVMASGNNDITLVTRFPSTANLWVNSNSTATLIHRITLVPAN